MHTPSFFDYPFEIRPLSEEEGGGFLITFPDLPGCMSDGETPAEAIAHGQDAFACWMTAQADAGREAPRPSESASGRFVTRLPRGLHARLIARAKQEGVSMNAFVTALIAEGLGRRDAH